MTRSFKLQRRAAIARGVLAGAALLAGGACFAQAGAYPSKPVRLVVGFAAGGPTDVVARAFADHASRALGQPFIIENKPGASTIVAAQAVASAPADGYTLLFNGSIHTMLPALYGDRLKFDAVRSFLPLCTVSTSPTVLVVGPALGVGTLGQYLAKVRAAPGQVSVGSPGVGSTGHFASEMFARLNGVRLNHIPYKGAAPVINDVIGGQLDSSFATLGSVLPQVQAGKLSVLAVASPKRSTLLPDVPTFAQAGGGDFLADAWYGLLAVAGTPASVVQTLERVATDFARSDATVARLRGLGLEAESTCGKAFADLVQRDVATYARLARELDIKAD